MKGLKKLKNFGETPRYAGTILETLQRVDVEDWDAGFSPPGERDSF